MIFQLSGAPDEADEARLYRDAGAVAFKVKVGTHDPVTDLARSQAVRAAVGDGPRVSADANEGYGLSDALVFAHGAGAAGMDYFEQPVRRQDLDGMRACAAAASIPISVDEGLRGLDAIKRHHDADAAKGGSLKPIKLGGAFQVMAAGRLMDDLGMHVNLAGKTADTSIGSAAIAHVAVALPQLDWDVNITNHLLVDDVVRTPIKVVDGHVAAPDAPGLGIVVEQDKLARFRSG
jgi:muconate cycloisomerase